MSAPAQDLRGEIIDSLIAQVRANLEGDPAPVERFVRQFLADVATEFLLEPAAEDLYGAVISMWNHAQKRDKAGPKIRIYNPTHETHGWHSTHTVLEIVNDDMPFIVDSVVNALNRDQLTVHLLIHPIMQVERDSERLLQDVLEPESDKGQLTLQEYAARRAIEHLDQEVDRRLRARSTGERPGERASKGDSS